MAHRLPRRQWTLTRPAAPFPSRSGTAIARPDAPAATWADGRGRPAPIGEPRYSSGAWVSNPIRDQRPGAAASLDEITALGMIGLMADFRPQPFVIQYASRQWSSGIRRSFPTDFIGGRPSSRRKSAPTIL